MNNIIKNSAILLAGAVALSGCIKETFPEGGGVTASQISDSPFAADGMLVSIPTMLITNYTGAVDGEHFDFGYPSIFGATDRLAGEVFPVSGNMPGGNQYYDRWQGFLYPGNSTGLAANGYCAPLFWYNYYQFIKSANDVISAVSDPEALGVAKTFRALYYLDLARLYEALPAISELTTYDISNVEGLTVPLVTENSTLDELKNNPRLPRGEMFSFIKSDLDDAEESLANYEPASKNLPSLAVVYGLKARMYLWLGQFNESYDDVETGVEAYKLAADYARKAITASGASVMTEAQWLDPKTGFNTICSSWMWAMIQSTDTVLNNLLSFTAHMSTEAIWGYGNGAQPGISVFNYNRISSGDWRKKIFVGPDRSWAAIAPYTNLTQAEFEGLTDDSQIIAPYASFKFHPNTGEKYDYNIGNVTSIPMMRVEEMYLTEAEAMAHYDTATATARIKEFMSMRGVSNYSPRADLAEDILFQKRIEFWGEGIVFYDMKRLNISMQNGNDGTNAPSMAQLSTKGRAPWWNCVIPLSAVQQNAALQNGAKNNPDPTKSYKSVN